MSRSCWTARYEAMGHEDAIEAMRAYWDEHGAEGLDTLAREAGYDTSDEQLERDGRAYWRWDVMNDTCLLDAGHAGPHEFTRTKDIILDFSPLMGAGR